MTTNLNTQEVPTLALTVTELCRAARISRSMYYTLPADQRPEAVQIGSKILIPLDAARAWLQSLPRATWTQRRGIHRQGLK